MASNQALRDWQAGVGTTTSVVGAGLSFIPGVGPATGAGVGVLGQAISAAIGLGIEPEVPEVPAGQVQAAGLGAEALAQLSATSGLDARTVGYIGQIGAEQRTQEAVAANTLAASLSPFDRKRIMDKLLERQVDVRSTVAEKIQMLDPMAEANKLRSVVAGSAQVGAQYAQIGQAELNRNIIMNKYQTDRTAAFANTMAGLAKGIGTISNLMPTNTEDIGAIIHDTGTGITDVDAQGRPVNVSTIKESDLIKQKLSALGYENPTAEHVKAYLSFAREAISPTKSYIDAYLLKAKPSEDINTQTAIAGIDF